MKKTMTLVLAALFCVVSVGTAFAQEYEVLGLNSPLDDSDGASVAALRVDPDANWKASLGSSELSLEETFAYQLNPEQYVHVKEDQVWAGTGSPKDDSPIPCVVAYGSERCREFLGG